jgi:two-component system, NarL family, sensor histidine kinase DegS
MNGDPYTRTSMDAARARTEARDSRIDGLHAEAIAAVGSSANTLGGVRDRYREAEAELQDRWESLRDELGRLERQRPDTGPRLVSTDAGATAPDAEAVAHDARLRGLRAEAEVLTNDLGDYRAELVRLDLAQKTLERTWLFLSRGDASLVSEPDLAADGTDVQMRIVEAQEAERLRLAQEIHDGPAQALSNAIFQVEFIERVSDTDATLARAELRQLREQLRRELGDIRSFISQLRPPILDELGLNGAIEDTIDFVRSATGATITADLKASPDTLSDAERTVVLRVAQEALQNVRKHARATTVTITTRADDESWVLDVADDGHGFDVGGAAARGRRNFGLQFMRERAELIGARLDVRSRPGDGTAVRLAIPTRAQTGTKESR